jgi:hypothetical protein
MTSEPLILFKTRQDAAVPSAASLPPERPHGDSSKRRPLGLAPGVGSSEPIAAEPAFVSGVPSVAASLSPEARAAPATMADVAEALDTAIGINWDGDTLIRARIGELQGEVSELKAALIEARHEVRELKLVQESLQISTRGESGRDGMRGIPGRDGQRGEIGPAGPTGPPGKDAPAIVAWATEDANFVAWPVFSNGVKGTAGLHLRGMFETYNAQVDASDAAEEADADAMR